MDFFGIFQDGSGTTGKHPDQPDREPVGDDDRVGGKINQSTISFRSFLMIFGILLSGEYKLITSKIS